jgi:oligopeptide transport system substrate-binding protein
MNRDLRKLNLAGVMVLLGTLALMVAGCGSTASGNKLPHSQQIVTLPIVAGSSDIKTLDAANVQDLYSETVVELIYPSLLVFDANDEVVPYAAASMPVFNSANDTYTFTLRPNLKWSDGTPITSHDFAFGINRALSPCTASPVTYYMFPIENAEAFSTETCSSSGAVLGPIQTLIGTSLLTPDNLTLVIKLHAPALYFLAAIPYPTFDAEPQQLINQWGVKSWTAHLTDNGGFGGGMYKVTLWDHTGHVNLAANPDFWGTPPQLSAIHFKVYQTGASEYADYLDGKLDEGIPPAAQYKSAKTRSDFHELPFLSTSYYGPNWKKAPFDNLDARQAFDLALNKTVLADQVLQGDVIASNHILPQGMPGYNPNLKAPDGTQTLTGDVSKATALMNTYATTNCPGYKAGSDNFNTCPQVTLYDANTPTIVTEDQAAVQMWQTAFPGYRIKTSFIDFNTLLSLVYSANAPQIYGLGWGADYPSPQDFLSLQFSPGAINNVDNVVDPQANQLMAQADTAPNATTANQLYDQAEQLLVNDCAWIPTDQQKTFYNLNPRVHNFVFNTLEFTPMSSWDAMYVS